MAIRSNDSRWGIASIALSLAPFALLPFASEDLIAGSIGIWLIGACIGLLGLWERGSARTIAIVGIAMNFLLPPVAYVIGIGLALDGMARGMGGR